MPESLPPAALDPALAAGEPTLLLLFAGLLGLAVGLGLGALLGAWLGARLGGGREAQLHDRFEALSAQALDRSSERFLHLAGERMGALERASDAALAQREAAVDALVAPLKDALARVDAKLHHVEVQRQGHHESLSQQLGHVAQAHRLLERETRNLAQALRTPNARGRWGELQLRRVVELAGMLAHCDFLEQATVGGMTNAAGPVARPGSVAGGAGGAETEGGRGRPDLIVRLPGNRCVAIDAKAPLAAYLEASEAASDAERDAALDQHARHVRRHLDELAGRAYWSKLPGSPEFVVLFLPGEPFFSAALARDPELIEDGATKKVLLAGPTTLIALLRAIAHGWQQEEMAQNAAEVARIGRELFDRLVALDEKFATVGRRLDSAVDAYNQAIGSLEARVHVSARRMAELGIAMNESLAAIPLIERRTRAPSGDGSRAHS